MRPTACIAATLALSTLIAAPGCPTKPTPIRQALAEAAPRSVDEVITGAVRQPDGTKRSSRLPHITLPPDPEPVRGPVASAVEDLLRRHFGDETLDEASPSIKAACAIKDGADALIQPTLEKRAESALVSFGGKATQARRVAALARELDQSGSRFDSTKALTVFVVCESV